MINISIFSQTVGVAHEEHGSEQDEREVGYSSRVEEAPSGAPIGKKSHKERLTTVETHLDVLKMSLEELYQGQRRLLGVESSQEEVESRIEKVESLIDQMTEDTKDFIRHLHEVVAELTAKVMVGDAYERRQRLWPGCNGLPPAAKAVACKGDRSCRGSACARRHRSPARCRSRAVVPAARAATYANGMQRRHLRRATAVMATA
ncbi:hypothetical protein B296_00054482 [Ensete ventricosum]|uniref:Uncharacterized protein n=1 Tax=Ensete ventricosum TaxID=4639 RepID=A0A426WXQ4_ENSVE|nr:hypothetical protein B296_00054482 [Ensete ventricosum]